MEGVATLKGAHAALSQFLLVVFLEQSLFIHNCRDTEMFPQSGFHWCLFANACQQNELFSPFITAHAIHTLLTL